MPGQKALAVDPEAKKQAKRVARALAKDYADAECALVHQSPFELLVATILSAQCTDERVNMVTPTLFAKYPTAETMAKAKQSDVEQIIKSTGFFRAKATSLLGMARALVEKHGGEVPRTLEELVELPGVGRKTANVVLGTSFGIPSGVVVDTHVKRLTHRLGLTDSANPEAIERAVMALLPAKEWIMFSHRMIHHGRRVCDARRPKCGECSMVKFCPRVGLPPIERSAPKTPRRG